MIKRYSKWFALVAAIVMLFLVLLYNGQKMSQQGQPAYAPQAGEHGGGGCVCGTRARRPLRSGY